MASTAPAAKQVLLDLAGARPVLAALVTGGSLTIRWAGPTEEADLKHDMIWLGRTEQEEEHIQLGGGANRRKHEDYTITVHLQAYRAGDDPKGTEQAWWVLRDELAAAVKADPSLTGTLPSGYANVEASDVEAQLADAGWLAVGTATVRCKAQT